MSVVKLDDLFNKIGVALDYIEQSTPQKALPDQVKELIQLRCNQLLQRVGPVQHQNYVVEKQNVYNNNAQDNSDDAEYIEDANNEYKLSNENVRILERFPTRESYNSYVQGPNDPLQPFLNNRNKNRLWLKASPSKTKNLLYQI